MPNKTLLVAGSTSASINQGQTLFCNVGTVYLNLNSTEANRQTVMREAGSLVAMAVNVIANTLSGNLTITVRKNGSNTALTATIASGGTGRTTVTNLSMSYAVGDLLSVGVVAAAGSGAATLTQIAFVCDTPGQHSSRIIALPGPNGGFSTDSAQRFFPLTGNAVTNATENNTHTRIDDRGTLRYLAVYVSANTRVTATNITVRDTNADSAMVVTINAGATGLVEDTANSIVVGKNDDLDYSIQTSTGGGSITIESVQISYQSHVSKRFWILPSSATSGVNQNFNITNFLGAGLLDGSLTETDRRIPMLIPCRTMGLTFNVSANTIATTSTALRVRKNGANGTVSLGIGAGVTGQGCSTVGYDNFGPGDEFDYSLATPNTSGTITTTVVNTLAQTIVPLPRNAGTVSQGLKTPSARYAIFGK